MRYVNWHKWLILLVFLLVPSMALAQEDNQENGAADEIAIDWNEVEKSLKPLREFKLPEPQLGSSIGGEKQYYLEKGDKAPEDGLLLNNEAAAKVLTEHKSQRKQAEETVKAQRKSDWNRLKLEVGQLKLRLKAQEKKHETLINGKDREIIRMREINKALREERSPDIWMDTILPVTGGVAVGVGVGLLIGALVL